MVPYRTRRQNSKQLSWATNSTEELTEFESNCHEFKNNMMIQVLKKPKDKYANSGKTYFAQKKYLTSRSG